MKTRTKQILFLFILAFAVRVIAVFILRHFFGSLFYTMGETDPIALGILEGKGYVFRHFNTDCYFFGPYPLYVYFVAFMHLITGTNYFILQITQALIAAFSVVPLFFIAEKIFNQRAAFVCGLLFALHPGLVVFAASLHGIWVFFTIWITQAMVCMQEKRWGLFWIGILMGLSILMRPTLVFFIPAFFVYLLVKKESFKKIVFKLFIVILLAGVVISPWIYRGYKIYNRFIFISSSTAEHFWRGNNPYATGTGLTQDGKSILSAAPQSFRDKLFSLNEIEQYDFLKKEAMTFIKTQPAQFLKLTVKKFIYFWWFSPQTGLMYPWYWLFVYKSLYLFVTLFFIAGLYFMFKNRGKIDTPAVVFLFTFFIILSLAHSVFYVDTRHRWMVEPLLMVISSFGIINLLCAKTKQGESIGK